jgi:type VI secretion system secreted protein VgrG
MSTVEIAIASEGLSRLACRSLFGVERVGDAARFRVDVFAPEPLAVADLLQKACVLAIESIEGRRIVHGVIRAVAAMGTSQQAAGRRYRLAVVSAFATLDLGRRCRVYQHLSVPEVVEAVLAAAGWPSKNIDVRTTEPHAKREYIVQYLESDATFIRRLCEEEGLYFRFTHKDGVERFVLDDDSTQATGALERTVLLVDKTGMAAVDGLVAFGCEQAHARRAGKVTLRDYAPAKPKLVLEAAGEDGTAVERAVEVYAAPGRFAEQADGRRRAREHLEALRAGAHVIRFRTNARRLAPGRAFTMEIAGDYVGTARPEGKHFVVGLRHAWRFEGDAYDLEVEAIPIGVRYRLPRATQRPRIAGAQTAIVTGAPGQEIHPEGDGRVHVRFHWDRKGPKDDKSSVPIRVAQPNMPGSMLIPRVGWEVLVAFEDGDPDRPYVLGRLYNAKQPPPFSLPQNKTMSCIGTSSSPGGAKTNLIAFDDAAGREHLAIQASTDKATTVANDLFTQTAKVEACHVGGAQERTIGGSEDVSVKQAYFV